MRGRRPRARPRDPGRRGRRAGVPGGRWRGPSRTCTSFSGVADQRLTALAYGPCGSIELGGPEGSAPSPSRSQRDALLTSFGPTDRPGLEPGVDAFGELPAPCARSRTSARGRLRSGDLLGFNQALLPSELRERGEQRRHRGDSNPPHPGDARAATAVAIDDACAQFEGRAVEESNLSIRGKSPPQKPICQPPKSARAAASAARARRVVLFHDSIERERAPPRRVAATAFGRPRRRRARRSGRSPGPRRGRGTPRERRVSGGPRTRPRAERLAAAIAASRTLTDSAVVPASRARRQRQRRAHHAFACLNRAVHLSAANRLRWQVRSREDMTAPVPGTEHAPGQARPGGVESKDFKDLTKSARAGPGGV